MHDRTLCSWCTTYTCVHHVHITQCVPHNNKWCSAVGHCPCGKLRAPHVADHTDNDLGRYTICSAYDAGIVVGGFQYAGHYVPLASGHMFVFDARLPHSMCGDVLKSRDAVRWTTATYLPATFVKNSHDGTHCWH